MVQSDKTVKQKKKKNLNWNFTMQQFNSIGKFRQFWLNSVYRLVLEGTHA